MEFSPVYEYRTTFALIPTHFPHHESIPEDLAKISPKPPKGDDWQLASSASCITDKGAVIFYYWERTARNRRTQG